MGFLLSICHPHGRSDPSPALDSLCGTVMHRTPLSVTKRYHVRCTLLVATCDPEVYDSFECGSIARLNGLFRLPLPAQHLQRLGAATSAGTGHCALNEAFLLFSLHENGKCACVDVVQVLGCFQTNLAGEAEASRKFLNDSCSTWLTDL